MSKFIDGLVSLTRNLINTRNAHNTNKIVATKVEDDELRAIYRTGIGSKIIRLKSGVSLDDTLQFDNTADKEWFEAHMAGNVKKLSKHMLAFGRALLVVHEPGADLSMPLKSTEGARYHVFSGDMVKVPAVETDLNSPNYYKPRYYSVRNHMIHPSRVVDFQYVEPVEHDAPTYNYGGISEFELIRNELVADAVVQRAVPTMLDRSSSIFYKVPGFNAMIADKRESECVAYFAALENMRSNYGAGIVDAETSVEVHAQALANLSDSDMITLRRLAMVTGLPLSWLVGEAARGLNSTGEGERQVLMQTISTLQSDYLLDPINRIMRLHGRDLVKFKDNQMETQSEKIDYQTKAIQNAMLLWQMGEDYGQYLKEHDVIQGDDFEDFFKEV